jgi:hypothetical protein
MFPIHTLVFAFWILVVDAHLIPSETVDIFIRRAVQKVLADIKVVYELLGNPLCTYLMKT